MAYMDQEKKAQLTPAIKAVLKKFNMKGTIGVKNYSTLVVNLKSGPFFGSIACGRGYCQLSALLGLDNFKGEEREFLQELGRAMMQGNHDRSDSMTDYFDVGWYASINIGQWNKLFQHTA